MKLGRTGPPTPAASPAREAAPNPDVAPGSLSPPAGPPTPAVSAPSTQSALQAAAALAKKDLGLALRQLGRLSQDQTLAPKQRAAAALTAARLTNNPRFRPLAELFLAEAEAIDPEREDVARLRLLVLSAKSDTAGTLALAEELLAKSPHDPQLLRVKSSALISDARVPEAVEAAVSSVESAKGKDVAERVRCLCSLGFALTKDNKPDDAVKVLKAALKLDPENETAHKYIAEYVLPDLLDPVKRAPIEAKFAEANQAYAERDFARVKALALQILEIDPNEGLAHKMYGVALDRLSELKSGNEIRAVFEDPKKCQALVGQLEAVIGRAYLKAESRSAVAKDLFPEWDEFALWQKAVVADSVLAFGELIPPLIEKGACFRFAAPGTSLCHVDPHAQIDKRKAFGRYSYSGRGWAYHQLLLVVTGTEKLDIAARGGYNTITHEFAHLVHFHMRDVAERAKSGAPPALTELEQALAKGFAAIETGYAEAKAGQSGQRLLCSYSGTSVWEYFAQGMMAYLAPRQDQRESPNRLYARNPRLFERMRDLVERIEAHPELVPAPKPRASGTESGSFGGLQRLALSGKLPSVRLEAQTLHAGLLGAVTEGQSTSALRGVLARVLGRVAELEQIDLGLRPIDYLGDPGRQLADMPRPALLAHARLALQRQLTVDSAAPRVEALQELVGKLSADELELSAARQALLELYGPVA